MHEYASSGRDAAKVHFLLGLIGVGLSVLVGPWLAYRLNASTVYVIGPSAATFYAVLLWLHDRWLWRLGIGGCRFSCIPDLRGSWGGLLKSSVDLEHQYTISVQIFQTWSRIKVIGRTNGSCSTSVAAAVEPSQSATPGLTYVYRNDPGTFTPSKQSAHNGAAYLKVEGGGRRLGGFYFTDRTPKQTKGEIRLEFVSRLFMDHDEVVSKLTAASNPNGDDEL